MRVPPTANTMVAPIAGWQTNFLDEMGLAIAEQHQIKPFSDDHRTVIPRGHIKAMLDSANVTIWLTEGPNNQKLLSADPDAAASQAT